MAKVLISEEKNAEMMLSSLKKLEVNDIDLDGVNAILRNKPDPHKMNRWIMKDDDKIRLQIKLDKLFGIDNYVITFVPRLSVNHQTINGVDTRALEEKMKTADWFYNSESSDKLKEE